MLRDLQSLYSLGTLVGLTDRSLIEAFRSANREGDTPRAEAALSAVIDRHAGMVWNVCRSVIRDTHDAEDAFQATFLILVRKAGSLRVGETLGPWLHVVAYRTALGVRASVARRRGVERSAASSYHEAVTIDVPGPCPEPADELRASIHSEIMRLPEAFRMVVVLCDLEGLGYLEAARRLNLPLGTVQSRLARARRRLRRSLTLRGIHPSDGSEACDPSGDSGFGWMTAGGLPPTLVGRVGRLGALIAADPTKWKTTVAGSVQALIERGLRSMRLDLFKQVSLATMGVVLAGGALLYADAGSGQAGSDAARSAGRPAQDRDEIKRPDEIPSPRQVKVASGQGRIELFAIDEQGNRVPVLAENPMGPLRTVEREIRWAVVTGVVDHHKVQKALVMPDRRPLPPAERLYTRVELQRQTLLEDGVPSDWVMVDALANLNILDRLIATEDERVGERFRVVGLVDPLPFLKTGRWAGVDVEEFLPPERRLHENRPIATFPDPTGQHDRAPVLMLRAIDFTVESGRTYRYRARVVFFNPEFTIKRQVPKLLNGPWSEATNIVTIPRP